jgi:hypothetical protein
MGLGKRRFGGSNISTVAIDHEYPFKAMAR